MTKRRRYDTYGFSCANIEDARALVERAIGIELFPRDSSYWAGLYYLRRFASDKSIQLHANFDAHRSEYVNESYRPHDFILSVSNLEDMDRLRSLLGTGVPGIVLLDTSVLEGKEDEDEEDDDP